MTIKVAVFFDFERVAKLVENIFAPSVASVFPGRRDRRASFTFFAAFPMHCPFLRGVDVGLDFDCALIGAHGKRGYTVETSPPGQLLKIRPRYVRPA